MLHLEGLKKSYRLPDGQERTVVNVPQFRLGEKEQRVLAGRSGSGKTTFLHLVAGILKADAGKIEVCGQDLAALSEAGRDRHRACHVGYVFQTFNLLHGYTALENVLMGMSFGPGPDVGAARDLLEELGLGDRLSDRPRQLSVGQQQRVALARALANRPELVLADEPTGNLDVASSLEALDLIRRSCDQHGAALLLVSHDSEVLAAFDDHRDFSEINQAFAS